MAIGRTTAFAAVALAAACATTGVPGTYEAVLPAASCGGERQVRVTLKQLVPREWDHAVWGEAGPGVLFQVR